MEMYRRGVASDASPSSRPLPLCGKIGELSVLTRLDAPPPVRPRGAAGIGWCNPVGRDDSARRLRAAKGHPYVCGTFMSLVPL